MSNDAAPEDEVRPVTDAERAIAAADWSRFRIPYGANGAPAVLRAEKRAFAAGWLAGRHAEEMRVADNE